MTSRPRAHHRLQVPETKVALRSGSAWRCSAPATAFSSFELS
ncbi:hypothetical protein [Streptomyces hygroscopicus]|nr:hypothetical protein [Streptomyces hygroscopicus]